MSRNFLEVDKPTGELRLVMTSRTWGGTHERSEYRVMTEQPPLTVRVRPGREEEVTRFAGRAVHYAPGGAKPWYTYLDGPDHPRVWFAVEPVACSVSTNTCLRGKYGETRKACPLCAGGGRLGPALQARLSVPQLAGWAAVNNPDQLLEGWLHAGNGVPLATAQALERLGLVEFADWSRNREWAVKVAPTWELLKPVQEARS